jgi:hypothetical protein
MRIWTGGLALAPTLIMTGIVAAQPAPPPSPPPGEPEPPTAAPAMAPQPTGARPPAVVEPAADPARPNGLAFGIGFGYLLPTSLQTPNITSVRVRLASGITLEPQLVFATTSDKVDTGPTMTNKQTELTLASLVHLPLKVHRKVDLELLGSAALSTRLINPNGDDNNRTITTLALGYGLGIGYWITPHWNLSLSASNPLLAYARTRQEMPAGDATVSSSTTLGLVFEPDVTLMIHLFD